MALNRKWKNSNSEIVWIGKSEEMDLVYSSSILGFVVILRHSSYDPVTVYPTLCTIGVHHKAGGFKPPSWTQVNLLATDFFFKI